MAPQDFPAAASPALAREASPVELESPLVTTRPRYWLHGSLFAVSLLTTTLVGVGMQLDFQRNLPYDVEHGLDAISRVWAHPSLLALGLPFSLTLMLILLAHEMGHYLACVYYRVDASLPYFIPAPTLIGTFGAFIRIRSAIYSKRVLFDIGIAGPLAGFVFLLPALAIGLAFSKIVPGVASQGEIQFSVPGLQWLLTHAIFPGVPTGDVYIHPIARAAWIGILATALNLLPIGQLDGGHILYAMVGEKHKFISRVFIAALIPLGFYWWVWWVWAGLLFWLSRRHPMIFDDREIGAGRTRLGLLALLIFVLCFSYAPVRV